MAEKHIQMEERNGNNDDWIDVFPVTKAELVNVKPISGLAGNELQGVLQNLFTFANDGKTKVASAVTAKGVSASPSDNFTTLASKIGQISTGAPRTEFSAIPDGYNVGGYDEDGNRYLIRSYADEYDHRVYDKNYNLLKRVPTSYGSLFFNKDVAVDHNTIRDHSGTVLRTYSNLDTTRANYSYKHDRFFANYGRFFRTVNRSGTVLSTYDRGFNPQILSTFVLTATDRMFTVESGDWGTPTQFFYWEEGSAPRHNTLRGINGMLFLNFFV